MPAGDPQRTWFPEMIDELRGRWRPELSMPEVIRLRRELDGMLHRIRSTRQIRPPIIRCPRCGHIGPAAEPDVSVRAMLTALRRFGIVSSNDERALEKRWAAYRANKGLDIYGNAVAPQPEALNCAHGQT